MVGYRNCCMCDATAGPEFIRHSDGGVSERMTTTPPWTSRVYQAFRWWGIGTIGKAFMLMAASLSGIPMVGYRNLVRNSCFEIAEFIRHSDGGVSEHAVEFYAPTGRVYQAFRWWGIGTTPFLACGAARSLSGIPMVGYRNVTIDKDVLHREFIRHSDGGVSEPQQLHANLNPRVYQAFRWWGIGTVETSTTTTRTSLSGIPMVGYRNKS